MRNVKVVLGLLILLLPLTVGCDAPNTAQSADFAAGAFPPTLSDTAYHQQAWTRADCLVCHEMGKEGAPLMKHVSVPSAAQEAKCRSCHVLIPGSTAGR